MVLEQKTSTRRTIIVVGFLVALAALLSALNLRVSQASVRPEAAPVAQAAGGPASTGLVQFTDGTKVSYPSAVTLAVDTEATLRAVWVDGGDLHTSISSDSGATWSAAESPEGEPWTGPHDWVGARLHRAYDGSKTWMMAKSADHQYLYASEDDGETWIPQGLVLAARSEFPPADMWYSKDGKLWVVSTEPEPPFSSTIILTVSTDQGTTWSPPETLAERGTGYAPQSPSVVETANGEVLAIWGRRYSGLSSRITTDGGATWSTETTLAHSPGHYLPSLGLAGDGTLWLATSDMYGTDVRTWYSTNNGASWTGPSIFTRYSGTDSQPDWTSLGDTEMGLLWSSQRSGSYQGWFGVPGVSEDTDTWPIIYGTGLWPYRDITTTTVVTFFARLLPNSDLESVELICSYDELVQPPVPMFDDGTHGDQAAHDFLYMVQIDSFPGDTRVSCQTRATNKEGDQATSPQMAGFRTLPEPKRTWLAYW